MKHCDPIKLDDFVLAFFKLHRMNPIHDLSIFEKENVQHFDALALGLTKHLSAVQQHEQPIMINSIITSCLIYAPSNKITFG